MNITWECLIIFCLSKETTEKLPPIGEPTKTRLISKLEVQSEDVVDSLGRRRCGDGEYCVREQQNQNHYAATVF